MQDNETPLMVAVVKGATAIVKLLLDHGAKSNSADLVCTCETRTYTRTV
jgi:ankyrin repeat protein